ncbi:MAG: biosynthetic-type acetolactate synthase large subunit, partial [Planctomycetes bacterium]|nr:biosynthetic-type acetolactate synthase large subunit [Planctomycetota bacterium]
MLITGAEMTVRCLLEEGVDLVFGYPGGANIPLYDALYHFQKEVRHILPRHEQGGVFAADGYARASGRVGVAIATSGPGATNMVTGIANASMDSVPLVCITGQVRTALIGTDGFQETDVFGLTLPIVKHSYLVKKLADLPRVMKEAFHIARTGRPGPVLVDIPVDVFKAQGPFAYPDAVDLPGYNPTLRGHRRQITRALAMLRDARAPVILAGGGVKIADAVDEFRVLIDLLPAPVTTTLNALGTVPCDHPRWLGMPGMHCTRRANLAINDCDVLAVFGARFDDRVTGNVEKFAPNAKIIHVDVDPAEIDKVCQIDVPIVGDLKLVLRDFLDEIARQPLPPPDYGAWVGRVWAIENKGYGPAGHSSAEKACSIGTLDLLFRRCADDAIIATDVGQHQMWAAQSLRVSHPRNWLTSGGLGAMGYGLPAAIGAQLAFPHRQVISISGDGGFQMNIQELATVKRYNLPVKIMVVDNKYLGMVRQWQELFWGRRYSHTDLYDNPDFAAIARAYGIPGLRLSDSAPAAAEAAIGEFLAAPGPVLLHFESQREQNVYPMVPSGGANTEMIFQETAHAA